MHKVRVLAMIGLGTLCIAPIYADVVPVAGSAAAAFANPTNGSTVSGNQWSYDGQDGYVTFTGASFSGLTPSSFNLGSITLSNDGRQPTGIYTADLFLQMTFTSPVGIVGFADGLQLNAQSGGGQSGHGDTLVLNFNGFPAAQTFTVGGKTYTVTYDGFFDSASNENTAVPSLFVENEAGGSATAYLWASVTAGAETREQSAVPEPGSVLLLLSAVGGCAVVLRRRQKVG